MFEWLLTTLSLAGTWFNIQKNILGWFIWAVANLGWVVSFTRKGMLAEATLFSVYFLLCIYGIIKWCWPRPHPADGNF
jgi:nicotinamide riboside transporter PnuC